jgi:hypothetical protein
MVFGLRRAMSITGGTPAMTFARRTALACALALAVLRHPPRRLVQWSFAVGMMVLASEAVFVALTFEASTIPKFVLWQQFSCLSIALLPAPWLLFSLIFARGDHPAISRMSTVALTLGCILPAAVALAAWNQLVISNTPENGFEALNLRLGWAGKALQVWLLVGAVAILSNLERAFAANT